MSVPYMHYAYHLTIITFLWKDIYGVKNARAESPKHFKFNLIHIEPLDKFNATLLNKELAKRAKSHDHMELNTYLKYVIE